MIGQKAIACTLGAISVFMLIAAVTNADWATSEGWREGLFVHCPAKGGATPLPFYQPAYMADSRTGCHSRVQINYTDTNKLPMKDNEGNMIEYTPGYAKSTFALLLIALLIDFIGTSLTGLGLKSEDQEKKKKYNLIAILAFAVAFLLLLIAAIIYPINFTADQEQANVKYDGCKVEWGIRVCTDQDEKPIANKEWPMNDTNHDGIPDAWQARAGTTREFSYGFSYGALVLSLIFVLISIALLIFDHFNPEPEEEKEGEERAA